MAILVKRKKREKRDSGAVTFEVTGANVGQTIDFMGIPDGFRITDVNVTVDEAFTNADNTISVGLEADYSRFVSATAVNAIKGIGFNDRQFTASQSTGIVVNVIGTASAVGKAEITVIYRKLAVAKQDY